MKHRQWTDVEVRFLVENYLRLGAVKCGKVLNRSRHQVASKVQRQGLKRPRKLANVGEIIALFHQGLTAGEIARKIGLSSSTVSDHLANRGLATSKESRSRAMRESAQRTAARKNNSNVGKYLSMRRRVKALQQERHCYSGSQVAVVQALREHGPMIASCITEKVPYGIFGVRWALRGLLKDGVVAIVGNDSRHRHPKIRVWGLC